MKKQNVLWTGFCPFALSAAGLLFLMSAQIFGQTKTSTHSPCVDLVATSAKNVNRVWANQNFPPCQQAIDMLRSASALILGRNLEPNNAADDYVLQNWLMDIGANPAWKVKFDDGFKVTDAMNFLKETAKPDEYRIYQVFGDVHGRGGDQLEQSLYLAAIKEKKAWYATIFANEVKRLNNDPAMREAMINRAYLASMGKSANADEIKYWKPRKDFYRQLVAASRAYLYAPGNEAILKEVVARKLTKPNGQPPSAQMVAEAIEKYKKDKKIFSEM